MRTSSRTMSVWPLRSCISFMLLSKCWFLTLHCGALFLPCLELKESFAKNRCSIVRQYLNPNRAYFDGRSPFGWSHKRSRSGRCVRRRTRERLQSMRHQTKRAPISLKRERVARLPIGRLQITLVLYPLSPKKPLSAEIHSFYLIPS